MEELYFRDVLRTLWKARWWTSALLAISIVIAGFLYASAPRQYRITMTLAPASSSLLSDGGGGESAASVAGRILGMSAGDRSVQATQKFLQLFTSPLVIDRVEKRQSVLPHFFPAQWDAARKQWREPSSWFGSGNVERTAHKPPSPVDAKQYLARTLTVEAPRNSTLVHVTYIDRDIQFGVALLNALYRETDSLLRERSRMENDERIAYIRDTLSSVGYVDTRESLTALLTVELRQQININSMAPFAMEMLEPPIADTVPASPRLLPYLMTALFMGLVGGQVLSLLVTPFLTGRRRNSGAKKKPVGSL